VIGLTAAARATSLSVMRPVARRLDLTTVMISVFTRMFAGSDMVRIALSNGDPQVASTRFFRQIEG